MTNSTTNSRRRDVGCATQARIDELGDGWRLPTESVETKVRQRPSEATESPPPDRLESIAQPMLAKTPRPPMRAVPARPSFRDRTARLRFLLVAAIHRWRAQRTLDKVERELSARRDQRQARLIKLACGAIGNRRLSTELSSARERIVELEERRARHEGAVIALEREIETQERSARSTDERWASKLDELERERQALENALGNMRDWLARAHRDRDRAPKSTATSRDASATIAYVTERIAKLASALADTEQSRVACAAKRKQRSERAVERIKAADLRRIVEARGVADTMRRRDALLLAIGEHLELTRPNGIGARLVTVDDHQHAIATMERRALELRGVVSSVDVGPLKRWTLVVLVLLTLAAAATAAWLLFDAGR